jgi:hypothetical protein
MANEKKGGPPPKGQTTAAPQGEAIPKFEVLPTWEIEEHRARSAAKSGASVQIAKVLLERAAVSHKKATR